MLTVSRRITEFRYLFSSRLRPCRNRCNAGIDLGNMSDSGLSSLVGVSSIMFFGAFAAGVLPAVIKIKKPKHLQLVRH